MAEEVAPDADDAVIPARGPKDIKRFLSDVAAHHDTNEIEYRMAGYLAEVEARGGKDVTQWSNLRHFGHPSSIPPRLELYNTITERLLKKGAKATVGVKPIAVVIIGPPGSGKSSIAVPKAQAKLGMEFSSINPDDVKELLPEYEGWNASALHEESSDLAERVIESQAVRRRHNVLCDITGRDAAKVEKALKGFDAYGYRVYLMLTDLPSWKAACRAWERFQGNPFGRMRSKPAGRYVPPSYVHDYVGNKPQKTFAKLKNHVCVWGYCKLDADVPFGTSAPVIEKKRW